MTHQIGRRAWERFSIYLKLPALFLVTLLVSTFYFSWYGYHSTKNAMADSIDRRLKLCVESVDAILPRDYHDRATGKDGISPEEYTAIQIRFARIAAEAGLIDLYVLVDIEGIFHCTASSRDPYFSPYQEDWPSLPATLADGETRYDSGVDSYGRSRSVVVRRVSPEGHYYCIGADLPLTEIDTVEQQLRTHFIAVGIFSFFLVGVVSLLTVRLVTHPLKRLSDFTEATRANGFDGGRGVDPDLLPLSATAGDEVRLLARNIQAMQTELAAYLHRLTETVAAKERAESEMRVAGDIQQTLLTHAVPPGELFSIWGAMTPAKAAGGDFYDYFPLDSRRLCFIVGDVSGKGVAAALFMTASLTLFRAYARDNAAETDTDRYLVSLLQRMDSALAVHNDAWQFVTVIAGVLDMGNGMVTLANGGHNPPFLLRADGTGEFLNLPTGAMLGVGMNAHVKTCRQPLYAGDALFLYTDGITEALSLNETFFGEERLQNTLLKTVNQPARELVERIFAEISSFASGRDPADDITAVCLRWHGGGSLQP